MNTKIPYIFLLLLPLGFFSNSSFSQPMQKGTSVFSVGLGAPGGYINPGAVGYGESVFYSPALDLSYEKGVIADIPHSLIGLGAYVSMDFHSDDYSDNVYYYNNHWTDFIIGAKGWYHLDFLNKNKYDVFGAEMPGRTFNATSSVTGSMVRRKITKFITVMELNTVLILGYTIPDLAGSCLLTLYQQSILILLHINSQLIPLLEQEN